MSLESEQHVSVVSTQPTLSKYGKPIGRPRKDKIADTLTETLRQIDKLCEQDHPSNAKARLLDRKLEFYTAEQKFQREQKQNRTELEQARIQITLDGMEIALLKKKIQELTKGENNV